MPRGGKSSADPIQVGGYAKKIAGTVFGNEDEKKLGEAKLRGDAP